MSLLTPPVLLMLGNLPRGWRWRLSGVASWFLSAFKLKPYKTACANIRIAFPDADAARTAALAKSSLRNVVLMGLEVMRIIRHPEWVSEVLEPMPQELLAYADGKPLLLCIPHLGNWELLAQAYPSSGRPSDAVAEPLGNATLNRCLVAAREANGLNIIPREGAARKVLKALHERHSVGLLIDQNVSPRDGGAFVNFFGLPATVSPLPAVLARKLDVQIVVLASVRQPDGRFRFIYRLPSRPMAAYGSADELSQEILQIFEDFIRRYPEQYTWLYHRWRYIPQNASEALAARYPFYGVRRPYPASQDVLDQAQGE